MGSITLKKVLSKNYKDQEAWFYIRPDSNDQLIINEIRQQDQYGLSRMGKFQPDDIVIDIGGHIGIFAIECAINGAKVLAFEPEPENYQIFLENIKVNNLEDRITVYNKAISGKEGTSYLYIDDVNPGSHSLVKEYVDHPGDNKIEVNTVILNSITEKFKWIKIIKLDCEGAEYDILENSDLSKVGGIVAELHNRDRTQKLMEYLMLKGYFIKWHFGKRLGRVQARRW